MRVALFEERWADLEPLSLARPVFDLVCGARSLRYGLQIGVAETEVSWMLEDNAAILRPLDVFGAKHYKTYRLYERAIA